MSRARLVLSGLALIVVILGSSVGIVSILPLHASTPAPAATGLSLDAANFCCPDYLMRMTERIKAAWNQNQGLAGRVVVKFTIQRDGRLTDAVVEQSSGYAALDLSARQAILSTFQLLPLPEAFPDPTLTVHLNFEYQRSATAQMKPARVGTQLKPTSNEPMHIQFNNSSLKDVLNFIGNFTGIAVEYEKGFVDRRVTVGCYCATLEEALNQILTPNRLSYKVINERTIVVARRGR